jgi:hypothetical protein
MPVPEVPPSLGTLTTLRILLALAVVGTAWAHEPRGAVLSAGLLVLCAPASGTARQRAAAAPLGLLVAVVASVAIGLLGQWGGFAVWGVRPHPWTFVAVVAVTALVVRWIGVPEAERSVPAVAWLPAALFLALGGLVGVLGAGRWAGWILSGDHPRHLVIVLRTVLAGSLDYGQIGYPRGWHALAATVWSVSPPQRSPEGLVAAWASIGTLSWCVVVGLMIAAMSLSTTLLPKDSTGRVRALAAALGAALILQPAFGAEALARGFETATLALLAVLVAVGASCSRPPRQALFICSIALIVISHSWQLVAPAVGVLWVVAVVQVLRLSAGPSAGDSGAPRSAGLLAGALGNLILVAGLSTPAWWGVLAPHTIEQVTTPGAVSPTPSLWLAAEVAAVGWLVVVGGSGTRSRVALTAGAAAACVAVAVGLSRRTGVSLQAYYPSKVLWIGAVVALPILAVAAVDALQTLARRTDRGRWAGVGVGAMVVFWLSTGLLTPFTAFLGSWSSIDPLVVRRTATITGSPAADVVWRVGTPEDDAISQMQLDFYRASPGVGPRQMPAVSLADQCEVLRSSTRPTVLSDAPAQVVRAHFPCAPDLIVLPVRVMPPGQG